MIETQLCSDLRGLIGEAVANYRLPTAGGSFRAPLVINGYLPPKRSGAEDFPFVLVRADSGSSDRDSTTVKVDIIIGMYSEAFDGHEFCLGVMDRVRTALMALPELTLSGRYQLRGEVSWNTYSEQAYPLWQLDMQTEWLMRSPEPVPAEEEEL